MVDMDLVPHRHSAVYWTQIRPSHGFWWLVCSWANNTVRSVVHPKGNWHCSIRALQGRYTIKAHGGHTYTSLTKSGTLHPEQKFDCLGRHQTRHHQIWMRTILYIPQHKQNFNGHFQSVYKNAVHSAQKGPQFCSAGLDYGELWGQSIPDKPRKPALRSGPPRAWTWSHPEC